MIIIGRPIEGIALNGLEYLMNEGNTDYKYFNDKREAMEFLNPLSKIVKLTDEYLEDLFMFLDTESDFENTDVFKKSNYHIT